MTETTVSYHAEMYHEARPAINVKCYATGPRDTFETLERNIGARETERLYEVAWIDLVDAFWSEATDEAESLGLGPIESEGRSGGWLVFTDGRDPQDMELCDTINSEPCTMACRAGWLAAYRSMTEWCRDYIAAVPAELDRIALEIANAEAVAP